MKNNISLNYNNAYKWFEKNNIYVIGSIFYNNKYLYDEDFVDFVCNNKKKLKELLKELNGFFSIVIVDYNEIIIISDIMRTFPVFYKKVNNNVIISDDINYFKEKDFDENNIKMLLNIRYVLGDKTIYKDICQLQSCEYVSIKKREINKITYYDFKDTGILNNKNAIFNGIENSFNNAIKRLIKYANGSQIVIPLSGGYDSRMIALFLKKNHYNNVICYTYGKNIKGEALISKQIADYLGFKWYFVKYQSKKMKKFYYNDNKYGPLVDYFCRGFSIPHMQEWFAINYLKENNIIDLDCVIVPGISGDPIAGNHIMSLFANNNFVSKNDIFNQIVMNNSMNTKYYDVFYKKIDELYQISNIKYSSVAANDIYQKYNYSERQTKFITNSIRTYDYYGYKWYLPYWDKEYINFWKTVNFNLKFERRVFVEYFNKNYKDFMEKVPKYKKINKNDNNLLKYFRILANYFTDNLNLWGQIKYRYYILLVFKRIPSYDYQFGFDYIKYLRRRKK